MTFPDLVPDLRARMPELRGRLIANQPLAELTWFRVGGPAQVLFSPQDEADLAYVLARLPAEVAVTVVGLGSNLIVRDAGVAGVVIRLGRGFSDIVVESGHRLRAGTAVPDVKVARAAQEASIAGLSFLRGIPGSIGGALRMNGGAYGGETKDVLIEARGVDRQGNVRTYSNAGMGFSYRHCGVPDDVIFTSATFQGRKGDPDAIAAEMATIKSKREASQPRNRTGGSTFKNPPGHSAWKLVDEAGCRGLKVGNAQVSDLHANFLINTGDATAADIETLGETVRARVKAHSGIELEWEIKRIGVGI
jgi:UDP-N-acetylmuramate dehydrogenase